MRDSGDSEDTGDKGDTGDTGEHVPALVINLDRSPERLRTVAARLREAGVAFDRLPAVDGKTVDRRGLAGATGWCTRHCTDSMLGCALSHVRAWQMAHEARNPYTLVMEDDVELVPDFRQRMKAVLNEVPADVDILFLGCFGLCDAPARRDGLELPRYMVKTLTGRHARVVNDSVLVPLWPIGAHCYLISAKGARKLAGAKAAYHIDLQLSTTKGLVLYAAHPPLAFQTMADSTISTFLTGEFPRSLNALLGRVADKHGISAAYYMSVPAGQVAGVPLTGWTAVCAVLGAARAPPAWVAAFFVTELGLGGMGAHMAGCALAYVAAYVTATMAARRTRGRPR